MRIKKRQPKDRLAWVRVQARNQALKLSRQGYDQKAIEKELYWSGFHPSICHETMIWIGTEAFVAGDVSKGIVGITTKPKRITCPPCGNILSADTDDELVVIGQEHARVEHNTYLTADYILAKIQAS